MSPAVPTVCKHWQTLFPQGCAGLTPGGGWRGPTQAPPPATSRTGGTPAAPSPPQEWVPASTQQQPHSPAFLPQKSPVCTQERPPEVGWIWLSPAEPGHACQGHRLVWEPPEPGNTLITLEVTGLRGGLRGTGSFLLTPSGHSRSLPPSSAEPSRGAGVTPDPAPPPGATDPHSQHQSGECCLRQGILTSPQCQASAEPGNASLECQPGMPRGPCAACLPLGRGTRPRGRRGLSQRGRPG